MIARIHGVLTGWRRSLSRSEWAIRRFNLSVSRDAAEEKGLLLIQIDGLSKARLVEAIRQGRMPFLQRLLGRHHYQLRSFYSGLPSTTPAVQAELHYGVKTAVPAFAYFDRQEGKLVKMYWPAQVKKVEAACARTAEGLLRGGSSWSNIYDGGAAAGETHFCMASNAPSDLWRAGKIGSSLLWIVAHLPSVMRILGLLLLETVIGLWNAVVGITRGRNPLLELGMIVSRVFVGIGARELITQGVKIDVARGLPIIHANFVGYDEHSHRRGPRSLFAFWSLRGIDDAIRKVAREAMRSRRRDYELWVFSDHGQERTVPYDSQYPGALYRVLHEGAQPKLGRIRPARVRGLPLEAESANRPSHFWENERYAFAGLGPVGHLYCKQEISADARRALATRLIAEAGVPGILFRDDSDCVLWLTAAGESRVPHEVPAQLPHPEEVRLWVAEDLERLARHPDAGDLVLLGWAPHSRPTLSFAREHGAHAGPGPDETAAFLLVPSFSPHIARSGVLRPEQLRSAALSYLGRTSPSPILGDLTGDQPLRVVTYNAHGCLGMDGRTSPRRVARTLAELGPDIVALQELDLGRRRSRNEDQASLVAKELGLHVVFCPTVTVENEHYGHALLSRWSMTVRNRSRLPTFHRGWWKETRAALWVTVHHPAGPIEVISTHLGLSAQERMLQVEALLGPAWLGGLGESNRVILCGDFNCTPRSRPYRRLASVLQETLPSSFGAATFTSILPLLRLDHIFCSAHFKATSAVISRSDLASVASDHLPLLVVLEPAPGDGAKPPTRPRS